jgi:hypothetical protein
MEIGLNSTSALSVAVVGRSWNLDCATKTASLGISNKLFDQPHRP